MSRKKRGNQQSPKNQAVQSASASPAKAKAAPGVDANPEGKSLPGGGPAPAPAVPASMAPAPASPASASTAPAAAAPVAATPAATAGKKAVRKQQRIEMEALESRGRALAMCAEIYIMALLAVFPLYLNSFKYVLLVQHKSNFLWTVNLIFTVAILIVGLVFWGIAKPSEKTPWQRALFVADWAALAYLLFLILSCVFSPLTSAQLGGSRGEFFLWGNASPENPRLEGIVTRICYLMAYFAASRFFKLKERDWALFAVSANAVALIGFFQFIGHDFFNLFPYEREDLGMNYAYAWLDIIFRTTLGNVDVLSAYVGIAVPLFTVLYCKSRGKLRFLYLSAAVTNFLLMVLGGADGGVIGVLVAMLAVLVLNVTDRAAMTRLPVVVGLSALSCIFVDAAKKARDVYNLTGEMNKLAWDGVLPSIWMWAGLAMLAVAAAVRFLPIPFNPKKYKLAGFVAAGLIVAGGLVGLEVVGGRISDPGNVVYQAREVMHGNMDDSFGSWRGFVWKRTLPAIAKNPLLGTGPDTFFYAFGEYQQEAAEVTNTLFDKAHNDLLEIAACSGLLGLIAYLVLLGGVVKRGLPKLQTSPWMMAAAAGVIGFFVQSLFGVSVPLVTPLFFALLGIIVALSREKEKIVTP